MKTPRRELIALARQAGAYASGNGRAKVSSNTTLLVRGWNDDWKHGKYGDDEERVAKLQSEGYEIRIVDAAGFSSLLRGGWARIVEPHHDVIPAPDFTAPYRPGAVDEDVVPEPSAADRREANRAHNALQDEIAELASDAGFFPLSPSHRDAQFDVGWEDSDGVLHIVEVKSLTPVNEDQQLRLGLGQVLDYARVIGGAVPAVAVTACPRRAQHWFGLGEEHGVLVVWPGRLDLLLAHR